MSSKVLTGAAARPAEPIVWRRLPAVLPQPGGAPPLASQGPGGSSEEAEALAARVAELEREIERREQQAFSAGFRKGEAAGHEQAVARLDPVAERLARTVEQLAAGRRQMRREAEEDVVKLAVAIGRRILRRELSVDPDALLGVVKAAMEKLEGREVERLAVHPEDVPLVKRHFEQSGAPARIEIVADPRLDRGAAIFHTTRGSLDASIETQLQEIERGLADRVKRWP